MTHFQWRPKHWGVFIFALWSAILAITILGRLILFSVSTDTFAARWQVWAFFGFSVVFIIGFGISAYGLWQTLQWGRLLFLGTIAIWSATNLLSLFAPGLIFLPGREYTNQEFWTLTIRHIFSLLLPLAYLNLFQIKALFLGTDFEMDTTEEV